MIYDRHPTKPDLVVQIFSIGAHLEEIRKDGKLSAVPLIVIETDDPTNPAALPVAPVPPVFEGYEVLVTYRGSVED